MYDPTQQYENENRSVSLKKKVYNSLIISLEKEVQSKTRVKIDHKQTTTGPVVRLEKN